MDLVLHEFVKTWNQQFDATRQWKTEESASHHLNSNCFAQLRGKLLENASPDCQRSLKCQYPPILGKTLQLQFSNALELDFARLSQSVGPFI